MKVLGGIKGIANDTNKLDKYFTIAQEINQIMHDFCEAFDIEHYNATRDEQHELTGNKNQRIDRMFRLDFFRIFNKASL